MNKKNFKGDFPIFRGFVVFGMFCTSLYRVLTSLRLGRPFLRTKRKISTRNRVVGIQSKIDMKYMAVLSELANKYKMFVGNVSADQLSALFSDSNDISLHAYNIKALAYLFGSLSARFLISGSWQTALSRQGAILKRHSDSPQTRTAFSSALNRANRGQQPFKDDIDHLVKELSQKA